MYSIQRLVNNYSEGNISYYQAVQMLKVYLKHKNISRSTFDRTLDEIEGLELTKDIQSGF